MPNRNPAPPPPTFRPATRRRLQDMARIGLFLALFMVASNVIPAFYPIPGVPVTLQVLVVLAAAGLMGVGRSLLFLLVLFLMTLAGIPMMSGFRSGPSFFTQLTVGYAVGWFPMAAMTGLYRDLLADRAFLRRGLRLPVFLGLAAVGILLCYACGSGWIAFRNGVAFFPAYLSNAVFFPFDLVKALLAFVLAERVALALPDARRAPPRPAG